MLNSLIRPAAGIPARKTGSMQGFVLRFAVGAFALILLFEVVRGAALEQQVFSAVVLKPAALVATAFDPAMPTVVADRRLVSSAVTLNVTRGCEGTESLSLFAAAVLAFPARWRQRLSALAIGTLLIYILSVIRLAALIWVLSEHRDVFDAIHGIVAPLAPLVVVSFYFAAWSARAQCEQ